MAQDKRSPKETEVERGTALTWVNLNCSCCRHCRCHLSRRERYTSLYQLTKSHVG